MQVGKSYILKKGREVLPIPAKEPQTSLYEQACAVQQTYQAELARWSNKQQIEQ
jgi:hypothetical protein